MNSNKQLIQDFHYRVFKEGDAEFAASVLADDYIQHNPMVPTGKSGFLTFLERLKQIPRPALLKKPFKRVFANDNMVVVHSQVMFMGKESAIVDLFRIENGLIAEHWDAVQDFVDGKPVVEGSFELDETESTEDNLSLAKSFVNTVFVQKQFDKLSDYSSVGQTIVEGRDTLDSYTSHRFIGEHNFVLAQSSAVDNRTPFVIYDILRLERGRIADHWSVRQEIPSQMAHPNGMI